MKSRKRKRRPFTLSAFTNLSNLWSVGFLGLVWIYFNRRGTSDLMSAGLWLRKQALDRVIARYGSTDIREILRRRELEKFMKALVIQHNTYERLRFRSVHPVSQPEKEMH